MSASSFPTGGRKKAVYDAYGNDISYNKGLPHERHPAEAAAMERYVALSAPLGVTEPSTADFKAKVEEHKLPSNVTLGGAVTTVEGEIEDAPIERKTSSGQLKDHRSTSGDHSRRSVEKKSTIERVFGGHK